MSQKKYKVYTPNKYFNGRRFNVLFKDGVAECTKREAEILVKNWGYKCPELFPEKAPQAENTEAEEPQAETTDAKEVQPESTDAKQAKSESSDAKKPEPKTTNVKKSKPEKK